MCIRLKTIFVLLLKMITRWEGWGRLIYVQVRKGGQGVGDHVFFSFCIAVNCPFMTVAQWFLSLFLYSFPALFVSSLILVFTSP